MIHLEHLWVSFETAGPMIFPIFNKIHCSFLCVKVNFYIT
jgi:hypothetical protein